MVADLYWASTDDLSTPTNHWVVNFDNGFLGVQSEGSVDYMRCVRGPY